MGRTKKSGSGHKTAISERKKKDNKPNRSRVTAEPQVQHLSDKRVLTQRQICDLIREHLVRATEVMSGAPALSFFLLPSILRSG